MSSIKFNSIGKSQDGHALFWPWEFFWKKWKFRKFNNCGMWVLYTYVFWHGESIAGISFTLKPLFDPFVTTCDHFGRFSCDKNRNSRILITMACGYSTPMFFGTRNRFKTLFLHYDHHVTHLWPLVTILVDFRANNRNFRILITMACGYSTPMFFGTGNRFKTLFSHYDYYVTHLRPRP